MRWLWPRWPLCFPPPGRRNGTNFIDYLPYVYRAAAYTGLGDFNKAEADIRQSHQYNQLRNAKRDKDAGGILSGVMDDLETNRLYLAAEAEMNKNDYEKAIAGYDAVLQRDPGHRGATRQRKRAQAELDKAAVAEASAEQAGRIGQDHARNPRHRQRLARTRKLLRTRRSSPR